MRAFNPDALLADGLDEAWIGTAYIFSRHVAVYSEQKVIDVLMSRDKMTEDDAQEFYEFNIKGAYVGPNGPLFVDTAGR